MDRSFPETLSALRREKNISQRTAAAELGISQALLSHYENGAREPGLSFVCRACDYYGVSADYLLGRSELPDVALSVSATAKGYLHVIHKETIGYQEAVTKNSDNLIRQLQSDVNRFEAAMAETSAELYTKMQKIMIEAENALNEYALKEQNR